MGINVSRQTDLSANELLQRFVGKQHIPHDDEEYWMEFLQYHIALPADRYNKLEIGSQSVFV